MTIYPQPEIAPLRFHVLPSANVAVIVAHPDDETLWAGGNILTHPGYNWLVAALCRKSDPDRSVRFYRAMQSYGAKGVLADLDDGPEQVPLPLLDVQQVILQVLPPLAFDHEKMIRDARRLKHF